MRKGSEIDNVYQQSFAFLENEELSSGFVSKKKQSTMSHGNIPFKIDEFPQSELTEVVCRDSAGSLYALMPTLARFSDQDRWITLIAPPANLDEKLFALYGIDLSRVLLIHPNEKIQNTAIMNKALKNGKSGIVIYWSDTVPTRFLGQWRKSAKQGQCIGVWVNLSGHASASQSVAITVDVVTMNKYVKVKKTSEYGLASIDNSETILPRIHMEYFQDNNTRSWKRYCQH